MQTAIKQAQSLPMSDEDRGHAIKARRLAHGIKSERAFSEETGVDRRAIARAEAGQGSEATYERLEAWLEKFEEEIGLNAPPAHAEPGAVTFHLSGNFGVEVSVSGPVENLAELEATVQRMIQAMGQQQADPNS